MSNVMCHEKRKLILRLLCEGNSLRGTGRVTGTDKKTIGRLIRQFGVACQNFLDETLRGLDCPHVEVDEIWTFVGKKQKRLTTEQKALEGRIGDVYLWTAIDAGSKLLVTYALGKRSADMARRFMMDLSERLVLPRPHESDQTGKFRIITRISSDGFPGYPEAVDLAFGPYADYGQVIKDFRNADVPGCYAPAEIVATERRIIKGQFNERLICTSHVERHNLTIRTFMKRFARLTIAFSKKFECLAAAVAIFAAYYNFCWRTRYPDESGRAGRLRPTAAMMAGVTNHLWSFDEFYNTVIQYG